MSAHRLLATTAHFDAAEPDTMPGLRLDSRPRGLLSVSPGRCHHQWGTTLDSSDGRHVHARRRQPGGGAAAVRARCPLRCSADCHTDELMPRR